MDCVREGISRPPSNRRQIEECDIPNTEFEEEKKSIVRAMTFWLASTRQELNCLTHLANLTARTQAGQIIMAISTYCCPRIQSSQRATRFFFSDLKLPVLAACLLASCAQPGSAQVKLISNNASPANDAVSAGADSSSMVAATLPASATPTQVAAAETEFFEQHGYPQPVAMYAPYDNRYYLAPMRFLEDYCNLSWNGSETYTIQTRGLGVNPFVTKPPTPTSQPVLITTTSLKGKVTKTDYYTNPLFGTTKNKNVGSYRGLRTGFEGSFGPYLSLEVATTPLTSTGANNGSPVHRKTQFDDIVGTYEASVLVPGSTYNNAIKLRGGRTSFGASAVGWSDFAGVHGGNSPLAFSSEDGTSSSPSGDGMDIEYTAPHLAMASVGFCYGPRSTTGNTDLKVRDPRSIVLNAGKILGREGLSGIQAQFQRNWIPAYIPTQTVGGKTEPFWGYAPGRDNQFIACINKTIMDRKGFIRLDNAATVGCWHNDRLLTGSTILNNTNGYGFGFQSIQMIWPRHLATFVQYDQELATNHHGPITFELGTGIVFGMVGPWRSFGSVSLGYTLVGHSTTYPSNQISLSWSPFSNM